MASRKSGGDARVVGITEPVREFPSGASTPVAYHPIAWETGKPLRTLPRRSRGPSPLPALGGAGRVSRRHGLHGRPATPHPPRRNGPPTPTPRPRNGSPRRCRPRRLRSRRPPARHPRRRGKCAGRGRGRPKVCGHPPSPRSLPENEVVWETLRRTATALATDVGLGALLGFIASRLVANCVTWVETGEPFVYLAPVATVLLLGGAAALLAAGRGIRAEPWTALRSL